MGNSYYSNPNHMIPEIGKYFNKLAENAIIIDSVLCALIREDDKLFYRELDIKGKRLFSCVLSDADNQYLITTPTTFLPTERMRIALEQMNYFK